MYTFILVVHILLAVMIIGLILVQQGKGAEAGASFGGGGAATVFGASGSANFMTRLTAILTALFFVTSLTLAVFAKKQSDTIRTLPGAAPVVEQAPNPVPVAPQPATTNSPATNTTGSNETSPNNSAPAQ